MQEIDRIQNRKKKNNGKLVRAISISKVIRIKMTKIFVKKDKKK